MNLKQRDLADNLRVFYRSDNALNCSYEEIFIDKIYDIEPTDDEVTIIDGGAHIGIAALYFKQQCPNATVICFEPNPSTFEILKRNIAINQLKNVKLFNSALSDRKEEVPLYGVIEGDNADTRGNSIVASWGIRENTDSVIISSHKLSTFLKEKIWFLKLDIEGAELSVLKEAAESLKNVRRISMEVHTTNDKICNHTAIKLILEQYKFIVTNEYEDASDSLPDKWYKWIEEKAPVLSFISGEQLV